MSNRVVTYRHVLLQPALRENAVEFRSQLPLGQDGKHHTLQYQGLRTLTTHNRTDTEQRKHLTDLNEQNETKNEERGRELCSAHHG